MTKFLLNFSFDMPFAKEPANGYTILAIPHGKGLQMSIKF